MFILQILLRLFDFFFIAQFFANTCFCQLVCLEQLFCLSIVHILLLSKVEGQECLLKLLLSFLVLRFVSLRLAIQSARVAQIEEGVLLGLFIGDDQLLFEDAFILRLCSVDLSLSGFDVLVGVVLRVLSGHQNLVSLFVHLVVVFIRCKRDVGILVVNYAAVCSECVGPRDALLRNAGEHVHHSVELLQVVEISVYLPYEAEWRATVLAATCVRHTHRANPGRSTAKLGRSE